MQLSRCTLWWLSGLSTLLLLGCGTEAPKRESEASTLKPLMVLYGQFLGRNRGKPPANEAEFKKHVESAGKATLESFGITDLESLFISSRDHKPYVILYGPISGPPGPGNQPVVAYEAEGIGGRRYVATSVGAVEEVDDTRFRQLVPSAN